MHALERNAVLSLLTYEARTLRGALEELEIIPFTPESVAQYRRKKMTAVTEQIQCRPKLQEITPGVRAQTHLKTSGASFSFHLTVKLFKTAS